MPEKAIKNKVEEWKRLLVEGKYNELKKAIGNTDPADIADILEELDSEDIDKIFLILDSETASDVIVEMDSKDAEEIIDHMETEKIADMIREMAPDDAADFFNELEDEDKNKVLSYLSPNERAELNKLTHYEDDSAGGLMTSELCAVPATATVQEAINAITNTEFSDPIFTVFVVDNDRHLVGSISISELLAKPKNLPMSEVMDPDTVFATEDEDQEEIANKFRKYDLFTMPVVDDAHHLIGRITADDVMDVIHEEASEDLAHIAGAPDIEYNEDVPWKIARLRLPWLLITMLSGIVISVIIQKMTGLIQLSALAAFVPVVMAMGGNTGMQSSSVTVRSIALGEIDFNKLFKLFMREMLVGMLMGVVCGFVTSMIVWFNLTYIAPIQGMSYSTLHLSFIVGLAMCVAMTFSSFTGTVMPILLYKLKVDPAFASGPFVTTANDLSASMIYFILCYIFLKVL